MRGPAIPAQINAVSQGSKGSFGMVSQGLSGNRNSKDGFTLVWAGYVTSFQGTAGSEYAKVNNLHGRGARAGDWCFMFSGYGNGVNAAGQVQGTGVSSWTTGNYTWMYDAAYSYTTLTQGDVTCNDMLRLTRVTDTVFLIILRPTFGSSLIGTLKSSFPNQNAGASLTFPGITKSKDCRGLFALICDRDVTSIAGAPAGWRNYNANNGVGSAFSIWAIDLRNPAQYVDGTSIVVPIGGAQTYDQTGMLFEMTSGY